jgi:hypothetical protein
MCIMSLQELFPLALFAAVLAMFRFVLSWLEPNNAREYANSKKDDVAQRVLGEHREVRDCLKDARWVFLAAALISGLIVAASVYYAWQMVGNIEVTANPLSIAAGLLLLVPLGWLLLFGWCVRTTTRAFTVYRATLREIETKLRAAMTNRPPEGT